MLIPMPLPYDSPRRDSWNCRKKYHSACYGLARNRVFRKYVPCSCPCHKKEKRPFCRQCGRWLVGPDLCSVHGSEILDTSESNLLTDATYSI